MKTKATFLLMAILSLVTSTSFGGGTETETMEAKKALRSEIAQSLSDGINGWNNYFYQHEVNRVDDHLQITFAVNHDGTLRLLKVEHADQDVKEYVEHVFGKQTIIADPSLTGKAFAFDLHLRYITH